MAARDTFYISPLQVYGDFGGQIQIPSHKNDAFKFQLTFRTPAYFPSPGLVALLDGEKCLACGSASVMRP